MSHAFFSVSEKIEMVKSKWGLALSAVVTVVGSLCISVSLCSQLGLNSRLNGGLVVSSNQFHPPISNEQPQHVFTEK